MSRFLSFAAILLALPAYPQETVLIFDPSHTTIHWSLGSLLHTVHGAFHLKSGTIHFDPSAGKASGELIVDALSGSSGSESRDKRMHRSILESARYTEITFFPDRVDGTLSPHGTSEVQLHGILWLHGSSREMTVPVKVEQRQGLLTASTHFSIPYVKWGLKNPSTFVLKVNDTVEIDVEAGIPNGPAAIH